MSKCNMCWDLARKFSEAGDMEKSAEAAELGHRFNVLERRPKKVPHDHEGSMARGELASMIEDAQDLHDMIMEGDELPGWVSAYITLASDYMHSVSRYMAQQEADSEEE